MDGRMAFGRPPAHTRWCVVGAAGTLANARAAAGQGAVMSQQHAIYKYQGEIRAMMFTFGEILASLPETIQLVEDMLHAQAVEWVRARGRTRTDARAAPDHPGQRAGVPQGVQDDLARGAHLPGAA